jgi:signal transduction histidine kinase
VIERELHDGVQQHLTALAVKLQLVGDAVENEPSAVAALLEEIARDVQDAIDEAALLAQRIRPPQLDSGSLQAALRIWALAAGVRATIDVQLSAESTPEASETVYFCCLGALAHVSAGADVTITVRDDDGTLSFAVVGGMPASSGSGFVALRDRVDALGGHLVAGSESDGRARISGSIQAR